MESLNQNKSMYYLDIFFKSILSGILIGIAGAIYLTISNKIIGSFLFSFGLLTIIVWGMCLYTGKIGVINLKKEWNLIPIFLVGNYLGTLFVSVLLKFTRFGVELSETALTVAQIKINDGLLSIFILSVLCGIMMYLAVIGYQKYANPLMVIFPIMIFILTGFEHSIANMFYFNMAWYWSIKTIMYLIIMIVGNGLGSLFIKLLYNRRIW